MAVSSPYVFIECDECGAEDDVEYSERHRSDEAIIESHGWFVVDGRHLCPDCRTALAETE